MSYTSFALITDTPQRLATFLESRGIIEQTVGIDGTPKYTGVLPGLEWIRVPNPIVTDPESGAYGDADYKLPTYDDRAVFLVKFAHESESGKAAGFRDWLMANTTPQTAPPNYTIDGQHVGSARKVNGEQVWLVHENPERFGVWQ